MTLPDGAVAPKADGPQDVMSAQTARENADEGALGIALWNEAYEARVRAEAGNRFNKGMVVEKRPKAQKWLVITYWSDVLEKNSMASALGLRRPGGRKAAIRPRLKLLQSLLRRSLVALAYGLLPGICFPP